MRANNDNKGEKKLLRSAAEINASSRISLYVRLSRFLSIGSVVNVPLLDQSERLDELGSLPYAKVSLHYPGLKKISARDCYAFSNRLLM